MNPHTAERPDDDFDVTAGARQSSSLILLRDSPQGPEVLMMRRALRDGDIRSGVCVFPGGVLEERDADRDAPAIGPDDDAASRRLGLAFGGRAWMLAAVRECFEETGLLLALDAQGAPAATAGRDAEFDPWRDRLQAGTDGWRAFAEAFDLRADLRALHYWAHWLTPPGLPQRFDTRFFIARAPDGQQARADQGEAEELMWLRPAAALAPESGLNLLPVTRRNLQILAGFADAQAAIDHAQALTEVRRVMPRRALSRKGPRILLPDEPGYAEVARLDPRGRGDALADLVPGKAVQLSARLWRLTAPNPGMMTGPGTNSYFVRDPAGAGCTVVDPGPADEAHLQALLAQAPAPIERILVTHTHVDHSPGAAALRAATGAPVLGRRPLHAAGQDTSFHPTQELQGGERMAIGATTTLQVIHTPGHASNHLCYLIEEERTLLTGDHVMQGSTVVINPPDGDMSQYLAALEALTARDLEWLAPGHGFLVAEPVDVLRALIQHRLRREAKVLAALHARPGAALDDFVPLAYDDVPAGLHPVARRSLLAHLLKLQVDGVARADGDRWHAI